MTRPKLLIHSVFTAGERQSLETFLDYLRDAVVRKARGVSEEDARKRLVPSATTLGGLVKHLAWVEQWWFAEQLAEIPAEQLPTPPYTDEDPDADFRLEPDETLDGVIELYLQRCAQSREIAARYDDLDHTFMAPRRKREISLRWVYLHMIEETGRHAGHADILREQLDGLAGD
jgi:hypothetical protein